MSQTQIARIQTGDSMLADAIETLRSGHAELYVSTPAETAVATVNTFLKAAGTTTLSPNAHNWTMPQDNRLTYVGPSRRVVHIASSVTVTMAGNTKLARITIAKNGTVHPGAEVQRWVTTGSDKGSTALHAFTDVSNGDYLEVWVANGTDNTNMTLETMNLFAMDMAT